jgi:hypothetical protein
VILINAPTFQQRNPIAGVAVLVYVCRYPLECSPVNHATPRLASTAVIGMAPSGGAWLALVAVISGAMWNLVGVAVKRPCAV